MKYFMLHASLRYLYGLSARDRPAVGYVQATPAPAAGLAVPVIAIGLWAMKSSQVLPA